MTDTRAERGCDGARAAVPFGFSGDVLQVVSSRATGGAEAMALAGAVALRDRHGVRSTFVCGGAPLAERIRAAGFPVATIPLRDNADLVGFLRLLVHLRRTRPPLVHLHMNRAGLLGGIACRWIGIPCLFTAAGMVHRRYADRAGLTLACAEGVRDHLRAQGMPPEKLRLVRNAIDTAKFAGEGERGGAGAEPPYPARSSPARRDILLVARLHPAKGHADLIRAFALLARDFPAHDLLFAGTGPRGYEAELRGLTRTLGVAGRVEFLGDRDDIPDLLARAAVFALPSAQEGLPLTVLEAMASGLPTVAYRIPGLTEIAPPEEGGPALVPPGDIGRLAGTIAGLLARPALRAAWGERAREAVAARFGLPRYADELLAAYRELLPEPAPGAGA